MTTPSRQRSSRHHCQKCGAAMRISPEQFGRKLSCPLCGTRFRVPPPEPSTHDFSGFEQPIPDQPTELPLATALSAEQAESVSTLPSQQEFRAQIDSLIPSKNLKIPAAFAIGVAVGFVACLILADRPNPLAERAKGHADVKANPASFGLRRDMTPDEFTLAVGLLGIHVSGLADELSDPMLDAPTENLRLRIMSQIIQFPPAPLSLAEEGRRRRQFILAIAINAIDMIGMERLSPRVAPQYPRSADDREAWHRQNRDVVATTIRHALDRLGNGDYPAE